MSRKIIFLFIAIWVGGFSGAGLAESSSEESNSEESGCHRKPIEVYAGLVGGIERMNGRRTEAVSNAGVVTFFSTNKRMLENNSTVSFVAGFLGTMPEGPILIGPEFFFGRGNATSNVTQADVALNQYYTDFQRKFFFGGLIRAGYEFYKNYLITLALGIDRSQFSTKRIYVPVGAGANFVQRTKSLNGFLYGVGFEKHFKNIIIGLDLKLTQYRRRLTQDIVSPTITMHFSVRPIIYSAGLRICYRF